MKQKYELMIIISGTITDEEIKQRVAGLKEKLEEVVFEEVWGMRDFAYPIKKQHKGYYVVWNFMADAKAVGELQEFMKLYPDLVRSLVLKVPEDYTPISLAEVEAGLEKLREEKAEKRNSRGGGSKAKKADKKEAKPATKAAPAAEEKEEKAAEPEEKAEEAATEPAPQQEEAPAEETKEEKTDDKGDKTLDQKLDEILSDADLGL